jgi:Lar family restriction alleviation protein
VDRKLKGEKMDIDLKSELPKRLKKAREKRELTQKELSERTGIANTTIAKFENGERLPSAENILKLALGLKVSTDNLMGMPDYSIYLDMLTKEQEETITCLINHWLGVNTSPPMFNPPVPLEFNLTAMDNKLKPCPFCGGKGGYETFHDGFRRIHRITCSLCKVFIDKPEKQEVITAWNKRHKL